MSRFASVLDLPESLRKQAQEKLAAAGKSRVVRLADVAPRCGPELVSPPQPKAVEPKKKKSRRGGARKAKNPLPWSPYRAKHSATQKLVLHLEAEKITGFRREVRFHPTRLWRFDFGNEELRLAVEIEGITLEGGRHQRLEGFVEDCKKYAEALALGWLVLRVTPGMVNKGLAIRYIKRTIQMIEEGKCIRPWPPSNQQSSPPTKPSSG